MANSWFCNWCFKLMRSDKSNHHGMCCQCRNSKLGRYFINNVFKVDKNLEIHNLDQEYERLTTLIREKKYEIKSLINKRKEIEDKINLWESLKHEKRN